MDSIVTVCATLEKKYNSLFQLRNKLVGKKYSGGFVQC